MAVRAGRHAPGAGALPDEDPKKPDMSRATNRQQRRGEGGERERAKEEEERVALAGSRWLQQIEIAIVRDATCLLPPMGNRTSTTNGPNDNDQVNEEASDYYALLEVDENATTDEIRVRPYDHVLL